MSKIVITYFFTLILMGSVVTPTYFSVLENTCEIELVDIGEEEENKGKEGVKELDIKIYYNLDNSLLFQSLEGKKRISFYSKNYNTHYKNPVSPPPELLT